MKPVKCNPVYLQMARAALIEKLRPRLEPVPLGLGRNTVRQRVQGPRVHQGLRPGLGQTPGLRTR